MGLTQRQRNELFESIADSDLDMAGLDVNLGDSEAEIRHRSTGSQFALAVGPRGYGVRWTVTGGPQSIDRGDHMSWQEACGWAREWGREVRYVSRDLWAELKLVPALEAVAGGAADRTTPFSAEERDELARAVEAVKLYAREQLELTAGQISRIEQKLDDLVDASNRVGPKDLRVIVYGTAFQLIVTDLIAAPVVQQVMAMIVQGLGHLFGLGGVPPALPPSS